MMIRNKTCFKIGLKIFFPENVDTDFIIEVNNAIAVLTLLWHLKTGSAQGDEMQQ